MSYSFYRSNDKLKSLAIDDSNLMNKQLKNSHQNATSNFGDYQY
jgi:hypothetical protein